MHLTQVVASVLAILASCGRVTNLELTPLPATDSAGGEGRPAAVEALDAVGRVAARFGVSPRRGELGDCAGAWLAPEYDDGRVPQLHICVLLGPDGGLKVVLTEHGGWSSRTDSLRHTLADSLARFGAIRMRHN